MPKIVDHEQRRAEIAQALWRVIARGGLSGAGVRVVAAEAGWSLGAVRHYFGTQDELIAFATELMIEGVRSRMEAHLAFEPGMPRARALLEEFLPLDDDRVLEARVWLELLVRAARNPDLAELRLAAWQGERYVCRLVICDLTGAGPPGIDVPLPGAAEAAAAHLHTVVDGLTLHGATLPEATPPAELRRILAETLAALPTGLGNAHTGS